MRFNLRALLYEVVYLMFADVFRGICREEGIRHIFYIIDPGGKSLRIEVENVLYKRIFFNWS